MERRTIITGTTTTSSRTVVDAKMSLSLWLRAGRANKGLSLEDVAKITKIQPRILERLEAGKLEGLPAEVFVRGFVRSFARCVGLDEAEALQRFTTAAGQPVAPTAAARALVESMSELAPSTATRSPKVLRRDPELADVDPAFAAGSLQALPKSDTVVEMLLPETGTVVVQPEPIAPAVETSAASAVETSAASAVEVASPSVVETSAGVVEAAVSEQSAAGGVAAKPAKKKRGKGRGKRASIATGTPSEPTPVVAASATPAIEPTPELEPTPTVDEGVAVPEVVVMAEGSTSTVSAVETLDATTDVSEPTETWAPKMPVVVAPSVPWRRPYASATSTAAVIPTLVIDDADPDSAERELEDRAAAKEPARRSFLPPILLDREDRSARQGGLTLAVIILLIAATLTLSYLMRRPSSTGDGVTQAPTSVAHDILA